MFLKNGMDQFLGSVPGTKWFQIIFGYQGEKMLSPGTLESCRQHKTHAGLGLSQKTVPLLGVTDMH